LEQFAHLKSFGAIVQELVEWGPAHLPQVFTAEFQKRARCPQFWQAEATSYFF
jgi:hypothetical protein